MNATSARCLISFEPWGQVDPVSWTLLNYSCPGLGPALSLPPPSSFFHVVFPLSPFFATGSNLRGAFPRPCAEPTHSICLLSFPYFYSRRPVIRRRISEPISRGTTNTVAATTCARDTVGLRNRDFTHRSLGSRCDSTLIFHERTREQSSLGLASSTDRYSRVLSFHFLVTGVRLLERDGKR